MSFIFLCLFIIFIDPVFAEDIRDIKPPIDFPPNFLFVIILLIIGLIVASFFLVRRFINRSKKEKISVAEYLPPWVVAHRRLNDLKRKNFPESGKIKEYYTVLSDILRRYIEDRFLIKAPEMTTQEFLEHLKISTALNANQKEVLKDFLNSCDMVKFAKYGPTLDETETSFDLTSKLIDETKEDYMEC